MHKTSSDKADKQLYIPVSVSSRSGSPHLPHPGLHIFHTRISRVPLPGPEETFQIVFCKRVACIHEKTSLFIYFVSASEYICNLIEYWYIISYWFLPMMVMIDKTRIEFPLWFLVRLPYFFVRKRIWQEVCRNKILPISK